MKNIEKSRVLSVSNSTILGCRNSEPQHIESFAEFNEPVFNSSENSEIEVFVNDLKTDRKGAMFAKKYSWKTRFVSFAENVNSIVILSVLANANFPVLQF